MFAVPPYRRECAPGAPNQHNFRNGRLLNLFFGSGRTAHWLPRYGRSTAGFKLGVSGMCVYVHVCVGICVYVHVYIGICRYVWASVCICMYASVCHQYLHLLHALDHWGTETTTLTTASPKHLLVTQHPGGPTQGTPGHVPIHCLTSSQSHLSSKCSDFLRKNQCLDLSCHGHRNGLNHPEGPKLCPVALERAWYRAQSRVLQSDVYLWLEGASKVPPSSIFVLWCILPWQ